MQNKNDLVNTLLTEIEELKHNMLKHDSFGVNKQFQELIDKKTKEIQQHFSTLKASNPVDYTTIQNKQSHYFEKKQTESHYFEKKQTESHYFEKKQTESHYFEKKQTESHYLQEKSQQFDVKFKGFGQKVRTNQHFHYNDLYAEGLYQQHGITFVRNVPSDGNCMYHALGFWLLENHQKNGQLEWFLQCMQQFDLPEYVAESLQLTKNITEHLNDNQTSRSQYITAIRKAIYAFTKELDKFPQYKPYFEGQNIESILKDTVWGGFAWFISICYGFNINIRSLLLQKGDTCLDNGTIYRKQQNIRQQSIFPAIDEPIILICASEHYILGYRE